MGHSQINYGLSLPKVFPAVSIYSVAVIRLEDFAIYVHVEPISDIFETIVHGLVGSIKFIHSQVISHQMEWKNNYVYSYTELEYIIV